VPSRLREEAGFGLVELLVAMVVMSIGIFALVAGFSSGFGAINRASKTSTAGALADQQMEAFRRGAWDSVISIAGAAKTGSDGRTYWLETVVASKCPDETAPTGTPPSCTLSDGVTSRPVKRATVTVRDGSSTAAVLITESSTFDQSTG
jgi:prepilin-type N-terminal cleavage/methylation domain-containing protein